MSIVTLDFVALYDRLYPALQREHPECLMEYSGTIEKIGDVVNFWDFGCNLLKALPIVNTLESGETLYKKHPHNWLYFACGYEFRAKEAEEEIEGKKVKRTVHSNGRFIYGIVEGSELHKRSIELRKTDDESLLYLLDRV